MEMTGIERIANERRRQEASEGWTPEHDDAHADGSIAQAGAAYALASYGSFAAFEFWPWNTDWYKPGTIETIEGRISSLVKAGALIAAEIDRLERGR